MEKIEYVALYGYELLHEGILALADIEQNGICIDVDYCKTQYAHIERKENYLRNKLLQTEQYQWCQKKYGSKFNMNSDDQLRDILYEYMNLPIKNKTKSGNGAVSEEALDALNVPFAKDLVQLRRYEKARNTYLKNIIDESVEGLLHPFFNLHTTTTFRSSSHSPNFQNIPIRQPEIKKMIRRAFIPRQNHLLVELDYSGIEVRGAYCYHKDPNMYDEITNPKRDMHRDMGMECYMVELQDMTRELRQRGKNSFVFPEFYGSYYAQVAKDMWFFIESEHLETARGVPLFEHLAKKGIKTYEQFENHIKKVEDRFWNQRFPVYNKWRQDWYKKYLERGWFDTLTGFRLEGDFSRNDVINYPVQGSSFHCLLWSVIHVNKELKARKMDSHIVGQIHDSMILDVHPDEFNKVMFIVHRIMTQQIRKVWDWIIIPLEVEADVSPVNGSWYEKKEVKKHQCVCGCQWMYESKLQDAKGKEYECPLCGEKYEELEDE
jgi:DNA polymerase-1